MNDDALNQRLERISTKVSAGGSETVTTRKLLGWFNAQRRRPRVVAHMRSRLGRLHLSTEPDFELAGIDDKLAFKCEKPLYAARFEEAANILREGKESPERVTVRQILRWFGKERRGVQITALINAALEEHGLVTVPDFQDVHVDAEVTFELRSSSPSEQGATAVASTSTPTVAEVADDSPLEDATFRVGTLATRTLHHIKPGQELNRAVTCMMMQDISHLPVMPNERRVDGVVTWKAITQYVAISGGSLSDPVEKAMQPAVIVAASEPFFRVLPQIIDSNYVLVKDVRNVVAGIVTKADANRRFHELTEPFLLLSEIENHIRRLLDKGAFSREELAATSEEGSANALTSLHDLSFGDYVRILQQPANWARLELPAALSRQEFSTQLDNVRQVRNDVMHFEPDSPSPEQLDVLRKFAKLLRSLRERGAF